MITRKFRLFVFLAGIFSINIMTITHLQSYVLYAQSNYPQPIYYEVVVDSANVRSCAHRDCRVVVIFNGGQKFIVVDSIQGDSVRGNNIWYRIFYDQQELYVHSSVAKQITEANMKCEYLIVYEEKTYAYSTTSYRGAPRAAFSRGDFVCKIGQEERWTTIDLEPWTQQLDRGYVASGTVRTFDGTLPERSEIDMENNPITPPLIGIVNPG